VIQKGRSPVDKIFRALFFLNKKNAMAKKKLPLDEEKIMRVMKKLIEIVFKYEDLLESKRYKEDMAELMILKSDKEVLEYLNGIK
jgi:hypothetical protein